MSQSKMIPNIYWGEGPIVMDRDEIDALLVRAAAGGTADRQQMIDRVVEGNRGAARAQLAAEVSRDREELMTAQPYAPGADTPVDKVVLEVQTFAKWNGIDQVLADVALARAAEARAALPPGILSAREAIDAYAVQVQTRRTGSPEGAIAPDSPHSGTNQVLNTALTNDLTYRVNDSYLRGYASRLNSGIEWLQAGRDGRTIMEANTLAQRVEAYGKLDRINDTVASEVDFDQQLRDPDMFARQVVSEPMDAALVEAAYQAGRWSETDPVIDHQLDVLNSRTRGIDAAPQVTDQDMREVRFHFADQTLHSGDAGLVGMGRAQTERAAAALVAPANAAASSDLDAVRNVLRAQQGSGRGAGSAGGERRYEPPAAGPSAGLER